MKYTVFGVTPEEKYFVAWSDDVGDYSVGIVTLEELGKMGVSHILTNYGGVSVDDNLDWYLQDSMMSILFMLKKYLTVYEDIPLCSDVIGEYTNGITISVKVYRLFDTWAEYQESAITDGVSVLLSPNNGEDVYLSIPFPNENFLDSSMFVKK